MLIDHLYIFFGKTSNKAFWTFFHWVVWFLLLFSPFLASIYPARCSKPHILALPFSTHSQSMPSPALYDGNAVGSRTRSFLPHGAHSMGNQALTRCQLVTEWLLFQGRTAGSPRPLSTLAPGMSAPHSMF